MRKLKLKPRKSNRKLTKKRTTTRKPRTVAPVASSEPIIDPALQTTELVAGMIDNREDAERVVQILQSTAGIQAVERIGADPVHQFKIKAVIINTWTEFFYKGLVQGIIQAVEAGI